MKRLILYILTVVFGFASAIAQTLPQIIECGLPVLMVSTIDEVEPTCDLITAPPGENGVTITNAVKVPGHVQLLIDGMVVYDSGEYEDGVSGMKIRIRGNTSAQWNKKPYKIKLEKKADLLNRGDDRYKDKDWLLLSQYDMNIMVGFFVNELLGMQWTPQFTPVNVVFNGKYKGLYLLCESVKRNVDARLNVDKTGFVFECDPYWWNEAVYFRTNNDHEFTFKYPDEKDITEEQVDYMRAYMNNVESSFTAGNYGDYLDLESFAKWILGHDILGTRDAAGSNVYMTKYDDTDATKVVMANLWDFDTILTSSTVGKWANVHNSFFYFKDLFNSPNPEFIGIYTQMWEQIKPTFKDDLFAKMTAFAFSDAGKGMDNSIGYDMARWGFDDAETQSAQLVVYKSAISSRLKWLDGAITNLAAGILEMEQTEKESGTAIYNLAGQRVTEPHSGLFISGGKKIVVR